MPKIHFIVQNGLDNKTKIMDNFSKKPIAKQNEPKIIRVSVSEAARLFGVDDRTIRRAIKDQELRYIIVQDRYKINFESLVEWSQKRTRVKQKLAKEGIGQYVGQWKIKNKLYSPNPSAVDKSNDQSIHNPIVQTDTAELQ